MDNTLQAGTITKQFFRYVFQNMFGMVGISLYIIADTFFISVAAGADGLTVLNMALPIYGFIFAVGSLVGIGAATRFTILRSQGQENEASCYFFNAIFWLILFSLPIFFIGLIKPEWFLILMGGDEGIVALGKSYVRCFSVFTPAFMCNYVCTSYVRNDGNPSRAMIATMLSALFNIVFDYVLVFPAGFGLKGAALATGLSPILSIIICITHFKGKTNTIRFVFSKLSVKRLFLSVKLGVSSFIGEMSSAIITTTFNFLILGLVGNIGVAAYGVIANYAIIGIALFNGIAQGSQPLISQCFGGKKKKLMKKLLFLGISMALIIAVILILIVWFNTDLCVSLFNSEGSSTLAELAHTGIRLYFIGFIFAGVNIVLTGYFSAIDEAKAAFIASLLRGILALIPCAVVMSKLFGMNGVWCSFATAEAITTVVALVMLKRTISSQNE